MQPRTDQEIISQTDKLAHALALLDGYSFTDGYKFHEHSRIADRPSPRQAKYWEMARQAQLLLTETDPDDALMSIEEVRRAEPPPPPNGVLVKCFREWVSHDGNTLNEVRIARRLASSREWDRRPWPEGRDVWSCETTKARWTDGTVKKWEILVIDPLHPG